MPYVNIDNAPITKGSLLHKLSMTFEGTHKNTYFCDSYAMPNIYQKQTIQRGQDGPFVQIEVEQVKPVRKERSGPFVQFAADEQEKLCKKTSKKRSSSYTEKLVQIDSDISSNSPPPSLSRTKSRDSLNRQPLSLEKFIPTVLQFSPVSSTDRAPNDNSFLGKSELETIATAIPGVAYSKER
ncbi:hypothetical protein HDV06_006249 [Boothiomyces sp. JEL0866]|nr:hypothetical protein HDV06_006249 [Boothiomyces sp. JEL0866]